MLQYSQHFNMYKSRILTKTDLDQEQASHSSMGKISEKPPQGTQDAPLPDRVGRHVITDVPQSPSDSDLGNIRKHNTLHSSGVAQAEATEPLLKGRKALMRPESHRDPPCDPLKALLFGS